MYKNERRHHNEHSDASKKIIFVLSSAPLLVDQSTEGFEGWTKFSSSTDHCFSQQQSVDFAILRVGLNAKSYRDRCVPRSSRWFGVVLFGGWCIPWFFKQLYNNIVLQKNTIHNHTTNPDRGASSCPSPPPLQHTITIHGPMNRISIFQTVNLVFEDLLLKVINSVRNKWG